MRANFFKNGAYNFSLKWWISIRQEDILTKYLKVEVSRVEVWWTTLYFWAYTRKKSSSTIASGATPIGSAERAPDDISWQSSKIGEVQECYSHRELVLWLKETRIFSVKLWLRHKILELRYRNATRMPWLVTKVRPRDPSCVAWYTHMDALCWYVFVSTTRRKSWWTHWVPWEPLGFILCKS
jgi:hypothetical protein